MKTNTEKRNIIIYEEDPKTPLSEEPRIDAQDVIEKALEEAEEFESFSVEAVEHSYQNRPLPKAPSVRAAGIRTTWAPSSV